MTRIAVIGSGGMLGHDLMSVLPAHQPEVDVVGFTRAELDITNSAAVGDALQGFDTVINTAAYTKVDDAQTHEAEAFAVNAEGARNIAQASKSYDQRLIHVSTDYVFDGLATTPYSEDHPRNPVSVYGKSKAAGEEAVLEENPHNTIIVRTAWLYGGAGSNFVSTMLRLASQHDTVSVVTDQIGQPTWSRDLAIMIEGICQSPLRHGVFHGTNAGQASWFDFAGVIFDAAGLDTSRVQPTTSESFVRPAPRPAWSVLGHDNWAARDLAEPRAWEAAFSEAWTTVFSPGFEAAGTA
jgi:dTDP-4-dehydrorhamnose reductase